MHAFALAVLKFSRGLLAANFQCVVISREPSYANLLDLNTSVYKLTNVSQWLLNLYEFPCEYTKKLCLIVCLLIRRTAEHRRTFARPFLILVSVLVLGLEFGKGSFPFGRALATIYSCWSVDVHLLGRIKYLIRGLFPFRIVVFKRLWSTLLWLFLNEWMLRAMSNANAKPMTLYWSLKSLNW